MATVTGLTAARMLAIEAASVVDGEIDGSGHLILIKHDGSEIDAGSALVAVPDASTTVEGIVELATSAETSALTDSVRAVTPASLAPTINALDGRLDTAEADITALEAVDATLDTRLDTAESDINALEAADVALDSRLDALEAKVPVTRHIITATTAAWDIPTGAKYLDIDTYGGGGGGGAAASAASGQHANGGGGQAGGRSRSLVSVASLGGDTATLAITIGAAGTAGAAGNNAGGPGGQTTVNTTLITAPGGLGGSGSPSSAATYSIPGGNGGTVGTGQLATVGAPGLNGTGSASLGAAGNGGSSPIGSGGIGTCMISAAGSVAGTAAKGYASGGGGGASTSTGAAAAGGAGTAGVVIIDAYY